MKTSKSSCKSPPPVVPTMEGVIAQIKSIMTSHLSPDLLEKKTWGSDPAPSVNWSFGLTNTDKTHDRYMLIINVRSGAFAEITKTCKRGWWKLEYVTKEEIVNTLFHALTYEGSPYYLSDSGVWKKRMEVM